MDKMLVLENGCVFKGQGFGAESGSNATKIAEIVFNTAMVGYQEILSDPSCCDQIVVMTYPITGSYGLNDEDYESKKITISGMVVREYNNSPSNFRYTSTLGEVMADNNVAGISGLDTREIARIIRTEGSMKAMITDASRSVDECLKELRTAVLPTNQAAKVGISKVWHSRTHNPKFNIVAVDCGMKLNILNKFNERNVNVTIVPYNTPKNTIEAFKPDGIFISNGPGNPQDMPEVVELVKYFRGRVPIIGIGLGHQIIALAYGAKTYKMKFGCHGCNHPVKNLENGRIEIVNHNHSYMVDAKSLSGTGLKLTHVNVLNNETEGIADIERSVVGVQFHPAESGVELKGDESIYEVFLDIVSFKSINNK